jgi:hypothetical protein
MVVYFSTCMGLRKLVITTINARLENVVPSSYVQTAIIVYRVL